MVLLLEAGHDGTTKAGDLLFNRLARQPFRQDFHASQGLLAMSLNELCRQLITCVIG